MSRAAAISRKVRPFTPKSFQEEANPPVFQIKSVPEEEKYTLMAGIFNTSAVSQKFTDHEVKDEVVGVGDGKTTLFNLPHPNIDPASLSVKVGKKIVKGEILLDGVFPKLSIALPPKDKEDVVASYKYKLPIVDADYFKSLAGDAKANRLEVERLIEKGYIVGWQVVDADGEPLPFEKENVIFLDSGIRTELVIEITGWLSGLEIKNSEASSESLNGSETTKKEAGTADTASQGEVSQSPATA